MAQSEPPFDRDRILPLLDQGFRAAVPFNSALELQILDCARGVVVARLPWAEHLVGNPENGVLHGGAVTALLDACCGAAAFLKQSSPESLATLDLRIDYLRPASPRVAILARAECYRLTKNVAFVRAIAVEERDADLIAHFSPTADKPIVEIAAAAATFMLSTKGKPVTSGASS
jgi:uncharacterized protein (TIGR00369 family)